MPPMLYFWVMLGSALGGATLKRHDMLRTLRLSNAVMGR
jgi:hypothetical protein